MIVNIHQAYKALKQGVSNKYGSLWYKVYEKNGLKNL